MEKFIIVNAQDSTPYFVDTYIHVHPHTQTPRQTIHGIEKL